MEGYRIGADAVDPAHAGMILNSLCISMILHCGPRACGDDPRGQVLHTGAEKWTPRMRG